MLISFGIYVVVSYDLNQVGSLSAYAYVGLGVTALAIVLWGYLSAWRENVCCTVTVSFHTHKWTLVSNYSLFYWQFIVLLCLVIVAQFAVVFLLFSFNESVASNLSHPLEATWEEELNSPGAMSLYENWVIVEETFNLYLDLTSINP